MSKERLSISEVAGCFVKGGQVKPDGLNRGGYPRDKKTVHSDDSVVESSWPSELLPLVQEAMTTIDEVLGQYNPSTGSVWGKYIDWYEKNNAPMDVGVVLGAGVTRCVFEAALTRPEFLPAFSSAASVAMLEGLGEVVKQSHLMLTSIVDDFKHNGSLQNARAEGLRALKASFDGWGSFASLPRVEKQKSVEVHCLGRKTAKILFNHTWKLSDNPKVLSSNYKGERFDRNNTRLMLDSLSNMAVKSGFEGEGLSQFVQSLISERVGLYVSDLNGDPYTLGEVMCWAKVNRYTPNLEEKLGVQKSYVLGLAALGSDDDFNFLMDKLHDCV